jgi:cholesterol transport system auxiliary component
MRTRVVALVCVGWLLSGCVGSLFESKQPVDTIYVLAPPEHVQAAESPVPAALAIATPRLAPGLEGARIAVLNGRELNYYTGARWGAELSQLVQNFVVLTLAGQGEFRSVAAADVRAQSEYVLYVEVVHFQSEYTGNGAPQVHVAFTGRLLRFTDRALIETVSADVLVPAESNRMGAVIAAFETATRQASAQLGEKVARAVRNAAVAGAAG